MTVPEIIGQLEKMVEENPILDKVEVHDVNIDNFHRRIILTIIHENQNSSEEIKEWISGYVE